MVGRSTFFAFGLAAAALSTTARAAEIIPEIEVTAHRLAPALSEQVFTTNTVDREVLEQAGGQRLDDVLRDLPGFTLFRRQSSRASHPTTQGVTLRGLGPSGAGRTLVLLDGVPQNDPFGGWIDWSRLPVGALDSVELTRGGGAGSWGNAALAGTIRMRSRVQSGAGLEGTLSGNSLGGGEGQVSAHSAVGAARVALTLAGHTGEGPYLIREDQRGSVDIPTSDRGGLIQGSVAVPLDDNTEVTASGAYSSNRYVNGIAIATARTRITDGALGVVHQVDADHVAWETHFYVRDENLPSVFSSINAIRTVVTPSLNQFSVPATAVGGNGLIRVPVSNDFALDAGIDARRVTGATHERFQFVATDFTRIRDAGGAQVIGGAFVEANWTVSPKVLLTASARVDHWSQTEGMRRETVIAGGAVVRDDRYPDRDGTVGNFRIGARAEVAPDITLRAAAYSGFRIPTLNELFRPFRVGNDITEANPNLKPERLEGLEAGATWQATSTISLSATVFAARLKDAVGNITIRSTPGLDPTLNVVVPAGGVLRQRQNIDRVRSEGVETEVRWALTSAFDLTGRYLYTAPVITHSASQPALQGLQLAQVARHQAMIEAAWRPWTGTVLRAQGHAASGQFDDDQNTRRLSGVVTADLYAEQALNARAAIFLSVDNLLDRTVEAGKSADGIVTIGSPRMISGGLRFKL